MRFDRVLLENYGPHRRLEFEPSPLLTAVVGPVGSGKTTVLAALEHLLVGRSPSAGTKLEDVCDRAGEKEPSRLVADLSHGPHKLALCRGLRRATTSLAIDGGAAVEGEEKVNAALARLVGPSYALIADHAFVKQGRIGRFLEATPAERAAACARLFGVGRAAEVHAALGKELMKLEVPSRSAEVDTLRRELGDDREALAAARARLADYADLEDYDRDTDPDVLLIEAAEERERQVARYRDHGETLRGLLEDLATLTASVGRARDRLSAARLAAAAGPDREEAEAGLAAWAAHDRSQAAFASLAARAAAVADPGPEPGRPDDWEDLSDDSEDGFMARFVAAAGEAEELTRFLSVGAADVCPTCGTATDAGALADRLAAAEVALPAAEGRKRDMEAIYRRILGHDKAWVAWVDASGRRRRRLQELAADQAALPAAPRPDRAFDELQRALHEAGSLTMAADDAKNFLAQQEYRAAEKGRVVQGLRERRAQIKAALPPAVPPADLAAARFRLESLVVRMGERGELLGSIAAAANALKSKAATLARLEAEEARGARARALRSRLEGLRDACEHSALPREATRRELRRVEAGINGLLDAFGAGFRVAVGEDLAFVARFHAGPRAGTVQPARRLSYGQKTLLAWAYWCEVNARFAGEAGQFCLDEPTYGLAGDNFAALDAAIAALRAAAERRGLQCWLVTHEPSLGRLFDAVVTLE